ncbi:PRKR-interacting protein 1 isoform X1 [Manis pentadactyla]|uniref:PRKR-interacting protein 1 isoform X1 n=1 Tax=Manis pentadactyla TaxID=143292 RepID=UPI00187639BC|nr:PRKR-interacting protein 1 isoform X1 [Manis pentadactyla]
MASSASTVRPPRPKKEPQALVIPKNAAEEQKLKLERLMKNPDKAVPIPEKMSEWAPRPPPEFVRDVMGSSAGAGSGEFHVYRHLRRREYQRQDYMDAMAEKQKLDAEFQKRLERNKTTAEEQTAKRRKKRQKLKEKKLLAKKMKLEQKKQREDSCFQNRLGWHLSPTRFTEFVSSICDMVEFMCHLLFSIWGSLTSSIIL